MALVARVFLATINSPAPFGATKSWKVNGHLKHFRRGSPAKAYQSFTSFSICSSSFLAKYIRVLRTYIYTHTLFFHNFVGTVYKLYTNKKKWLWATQMFKFTKRRERPPLTNFKIWIYHKEYSLIFRRDFRSQNECLPGGPRLFPLFPDPWLIKWSVTTSGTRGDVQYSKALEFDSSTTDCKVPLSWVLAEVSECVVFLELRVSCTM